MSDEKNGRETPARKSGGEPGGPVGSDPAIHPRLDEIIQRRVDEALNARVTPHHPSPEIADLLRAALVTDGERPLQVIAMVTVQADGTLSLASAAAGRRVAPVELLGLLSWAGTAIAAKLGG